MCIYHSENILFTKWILPGVTLIEYETYIQQMFSEMILKMLRQFPFPSYYEQSSNEHNVSLQQDFLFLDALVSNPNKVNKGSPFLVSTLAVFVRCFRDLTLTGVRWYFKVVLICISLIEEYAEYFKAFVSHYFSFETSLFRQSIF